MYVASDKRTFILATCARSITSDTCRFVNVSADAKGKVQPLVFYTRKSIVDGCNGGNIQLDPSGVGYKSLAVMCSICDF